MQCPLHNQKVNKPSFHGASCQLAPFNTLNTQSTALTNSSVMVASVVYGEWRWQHYQNLLNSVFVPYMSASVIECRSILAPKLTSHACAPQVCSPPAAIAVTPAISQTSMCKALRIDSSWHAHINEHCHETWSFCLIYCILSKSSEIFRQMGCIYQLQHFLLDQITDGRWPGN